MKPIRSDKIRNRARHCYADSCRTDMAILLFREAVVKPLERTIKILIVIILLYAVYGYLDLLEQKRCLNYSTPTACGLEGQE